ncbi:MAG: vanadium-dependent haloperoxidase, partial [Gemmataceae bacterium]
LFPKRAKRFRSVSEQMLEAVPNGAARKRGLDLGVYVARRLLRERQDDSWAGVYRVPAVVGIWRPTPPDKTEPLLPGWGEVKPFGVRDKDKFRAPAPPDLTSDEYARDFNEVKGLGGLDSPNRTADQTLVALFWNDDAGSCTLPGHWNQIAAEVSWKKNLSLANNARLFALLNVALVDASICCWRCKFQFRYWRPITAIHEADRDANEATVANPRWKPLLQTPPFPSYTSGHSTFSGAAAGILEGYFNEQIAFSIGSDGRFGRRSYNSFRQAAEEAGRSRIYGGIQFEFDNREGQAVGRAVAREILKTRLTPSSAAADPTVSVPRGHP